MSISIDRGDANDVDELHELHHHHQRIGPQSETFVDDEPLWSIRSANYREWLTEDDSFLLLARDGDELLGYAVIRVMPGPAGSAMPGRCPTPSRS